MTDRKIEEIKQEVHEIQSASPNKEQVTLIENIAKEIGASIPEWRLTHDSTNIQTINFIAKSIHTVLQTEMMLNACLSAKESNELAKRSCRWAAIAAIAACIGVVLTCVGVVITWCIRVY
jgi:cytochrome bd-type quinol oxidase subunit 2